MSRSEFPTSVRNEAWARCDGRCEWPGCSIKLRPGGFAFDHIMPDGLGGKPTIDNCQVLCRTHHALKTAEQDNPVMTKADNQKKGIFGLRVSRNPVPGSKASGWRKPFNGPAVRR